MKRHHNSNWWQEPIFFFSFSPSSSSVNVFHNTSHASFWQTYIVKHVIAQVVILALQIQDNSFPILFTFEEKKGNSKLIAL